MIRALIISPQKVLFDGDCSSIIVPGEEGECEILSFHKDFLSRLLPGIITVDRRDEFAIRRGIVKVERNAVIIIAELQH